MAKQRVLLVDDEPLVLQGLQRMLRSLRDEWDMNFAGGGEEALRLMEASPFDVIVTDMRMPGMNGTQLLQEVSVRHPEMVRLVLSGHADSGLVAQCVGVAHQFISKPCEPDQLRALVRNACLLSGKLVSAEVKKVVGAIDRLPSVPRVYAEMREALKREDAGPKELGAIIQRDIGMTAKILKMVNSAFFGLRRTITSPKEAVVYLGTDTVRNLVLAQSIFEDGASFQCRAFRLDDLWHHSLTVGASARAIARHEGCAKEVVEECFVGGILHDVGVLVLATNFPETYDQVAKLVQEERVTIPTAEQELFGVTHAEVGAYLLGLWGLPSSVLEVVSLHHRAAQIQQSEFTVVQAVHIADVFGTKGRNHPIFEVDEAHYEAYRCHMSKARLDAWIDAMKNIEEA